MSSRDPGVADPDVPSLGLGHDRTGGLEPAAELPPILSGSDTPEVRRRVESFIANLHEVFESWVRQTESPNTQDAKRRSWLQFCSFLELDWEKRPWEALKVTVLDVRRFRDHMVELERAPKTIHGRLACLSSFYRYLGAAASEMRLPVVVPNPAAAKLVGWGESDAVQPTPSISVARMRKLLAATAGDTVVEKRDRAIVYVFAFTGCRISELCKLNVGDVVIDEDDAGIRFTRKGGKRTTVGIEPRAAAAVDEYLEAAGIERGPLFRPRKSSKSQVLAARHMTRGAVDNVLRTFLAGLPSPTKDADSRYTPHSFRAAVINALLEASVGIEEVADLVGHSNVNTTKGYQRKRRAMTDSASHKLPY